MRPPRLRERDRRALLLGAIVLVPALVFTFGVKPYAAALADARARLASGRGLLAREQALLARAEAFPAGLERTEAALRREAPRLFIGTDPLAATGSLSGYIADHARASRVLLQQIDPVGTEPAGIGLVALRVAIRATGDLDGILAFLDGLEEGRRLVRVERIELLRVERYRDEAAEDMVVLGLSAQISGYAVVEPDGAPGTGGAGGAPVALGGAP